MSRISHFLKMLDMNGIKPAFFINKKEKFQTALMGSMNLIFIILILSSFIHFGQELIDYVKPEVTLAQEYDDIPQEYVIDFNNYNIMIDIQNPSWQNYYNDSIYNIQAKYNRLYSNGSFFQDDLPLLPCTEDLFGEDNRLLYRSTQTANNWCIDRGKVSNITLKGRFNNPEYH
mgnify:CR=1 FL=1